MVVVIYSTILQFERIYFVETKVVKAITTFVCTKYIVYSMKYMARSI